MIHSCKLRTWHGVVWEGEGCGAEVETMREAVREWAGSAGKPIQRFRGDERIPGRRRLAIHQNMIEESARLD